MRTSLCSGVTALLGFACFIRVIEASRGFPLNQECFCPNVSGKFRDEQFAAHESMVVQVCISQANRVLKFTMGHQQNGKRQDPFDVQCYFGAISDFHHCMHFDKAQDWAALSQADAKSIDHVV